MSIPATLRGLFGVLGDYTCFPFTEGYGLAERILEATNAIAKEHGAIGIWSYPRRSALKAYQRAGFTQTSDFSEGEYADANCYVVNMFADKMELSNGSDPTEHPNG